MKPSPGRENAHREIERLLRRLQEIEARLVHLAGERVDSLITPAGRSCLLRPMQEKLRQSEAQLTRSLEQTKPSARAN